MPTCPYKPDRIHRPARIKCLPVADNYTRECVDFTTDFGICGHYVARLLDQAATFPGYLQAVRTVNGPEFTCRAFMTWAQKHAIQHNLIKPASPTQTLT